VQRHTLTGLLRRLTKIVDDEGNVKSGVPGQVRGKKVQLQFRPAKGVLDAGIEEMVGAQGKEADSKTTFS
jgi:hypothetical protein